jgi:hypothetical protein
MIRVAQNGWDEDCESAATFVSDVIVAHCFYHGESHGEDKLTYDEH